MKRLLSILPLFAALIGCSEAPKSTPAATAEKKEPAKPPEPVGGLSAFHAMFIQARNWSTDAQGLRVGNLDLNEVKTVDGKAGAWEATFVSPSRGRQRRYTYSVIEVPSANLHQGVFGGPEDSWAPGGQARPFLVQAFKVDSVKAFEVAKAKGADYAKKHPDMPIKFLLESTPRFPDPAWRVIWGESVSTSSFSIFVDATTGDYLSTAR